MKWVVLIAAGALILGAEFKACEWCTFAAIGTALLFMVITMTEDIMGKHNGNTDAERNGLERCKED